MDSNNRGAGRTVTCSAPEKLDCVLPGLLAVGAVWVLCGACGRVQVIWCYGFYKKNLVLRSGAALDLKINKYP